MNILIAIFSLIIIPIVVTLVWEFFLRDYLLPVFKRFKYRMSRLLHKEPSMGEYFRYLSNLCEGYENTKAIMKCEDYMSLCVDGCFEIIHSHLYRGWREYDIEFLPLAKVKPSPDDLIQLGVKYPPSPPNNGKYRLYRYIPDSSERPKLEIQLAPTDYFSTYPIQRRIFEDVLEDDEGNFCSPFNKYGKGMLDFGDHPIPNIVCLHTIVELQSNNLLLIQRVRSTDGVDWHHGKWSCSFEEQMTAKVGTPRNDKTFFDTIYAGCEEELGLLKDKITDIRILSIVLESDGYVVDPIAFVLANANIDDIRGYWQLKARDGVSRELRNVDQIEWSFEAITPILRRKSVQLETRKIEPQEWHVTSRMRFLVSLFYHFGIEHTIRVTTQSRNEAVIK